MFTLYIVKPCNQMRPPKQLPRWGIHYREPVDNWINGPVALLGDAAHLMLQYMAQGAAMAMEDAVALGFACDAADGDFEKAFKRYQEMRLLRRSRGAHLAKNPLGPVFPLAQPPRRHRRND